MLDQSTKKKIDNARDILVGKVPDPKSQVEQITIALIYKFMDDMDKKSEEWGGKPTFFTGEYEKYAWSKIFDPRLGGFDLIALYADAIVKMNQNPNIPQLFRDIFKNAYLPYRDPETLKSFLKEINEFTYDHSEQLGDAFEYLLSVMDSQGDAGQFRTPRHIIDFIVEIVAPKKNDRVLDPACGTAGFLISSYKHILKDNTKDRNGDQLTPDERKRLLNNFMGYDISPDMVRLSLVNLYLHGFSDPKIVEYDTLTSEEKWNETADVMLANPPFMTPKGGIRPHKRFSIQAKRSEVLFVDYIAEHLNPHGRAGVIVPEGIIFQSQTAYKNLRKMLVENYLWAVVSLPAGVFQPYSGVKTSILLMDKTLVKKSDKILFVKIDSDGFNLGAQRRPIDKNDLPQALELIKDYKNAIIDGREVKVVDFILVVEKSKIAEIGDWNLSVERYRESDKLRVSNYEQVGLGEVCEYVRGLTYSKNDEVKDGGLIVLRANNISLDSNTINLTELKRVSKTVRVKEKQKLKKNDIFICASSGSKSHIGKVAFVDKDLEYYFGGFMAVLRTKGNIESKYLFEILKSIHFKNHVEQNTVGANIRNLNFSIIDSFKIPLPPLDVQKAIVAEIDGYQKIIDGARQVVDNYKPIIKIDPDWEMVAFTDVCSFEYGKGLPKKDRKDGDYPVVGSNGISGWHNEFLIEGPAIVIGRKGSAGEVNWIEENCFPIDTTYYVRLQKKEYDFRFLYYILKAMNLQKFKDGAGVPGLNRNDVYNREKIPLPPISIQQGIVAQIEAEQEIVNSNKKLIEMFGQKIKDKISEVWGEKE